MADCTEDYKELVQNLIWIWEYNEALFHKYIDPILQPIKDAFKILNIKVKNNAWDNTSEEK